ncbi:ankyrin repeat-containing protein [Rutstroemia sp. NJR-2017a BVV2]|nr:ankyrin repeat-containing protein [Rutstroemia sp. NJR-2017a BVV2]
MTSFTQSDFEAVLANYRPREAKFHAPATVELQLKEFAALPISEDVDSNHAAWNSPSTTSTVQSTYKSSVPYSLPATNEKDKYKRSVPRFLPVTSNESSYEYPIVHFPPINDKAVVYSLPATAAEDSTNRSSTAYSPRLAPLTVAHKNVGWLSHAGVRGMVTTVCDGTFKGRPASLIILTFALRSGDHGFRFKQANVKVAFAPHPSASSNEPGPSVVKFAPRKLYGRPTVEGKKHTVDGEFSLQVPAGPVTVGPSVSVGHESTFEKNHRYSLVGNFWSSNQESGWDIVYWDMKENRRTKEGIPDQLVVGIIVERHGPFTAEVEVTVDTPMMNGIFGFPWTKERPVTFVPGVETGESSVRTRMFEDLNTEDWKMLTPPEGEWENKMTAEPSGKSSAPPKYTEVRP